MKTKSCIVMLIVSVGLTLGFGASEASTGGKYEPGLSPDEVENQIAQDQKADPLYESQLFLPVRDWRDGVAEKIGLHLHIAHTLLWTISTAFCNRRATVV